MMILYYSMGVTFLLINLLYTIITPIAGLFFLYSLKEGKEQTDIWVQNQRILLSLRCELTLIWMLQWLVFLHKVCPTNYNMIVIPKSLSTTTKEKESERSEQKIDSSSDQKEV